jgi:hypothetical protein
MWRFCVGKIGVFGRIFVNLGLKTRNSDRMSGLMCRLALILIVVVCSAGNLAAKDWRGILPMHSTRADVERLLGPPTTARPGLLSYEIEEGEILFILRNKEFPPVSDCPANPAENTVLSIRVLPKGELSPKNLNLTGFRTFHPTQFIDPDYLGYVNEAEGFVIRTYKGLVDEMVYLASAVDRPGCPGYYSELLSFVTVRSAVCGLRSKFDEYGDIKFADEEARLDNYAIQLEIAPDQRAYLVVYGGRRAVAAEAEMRGARAKNYLVNVRKIDPTRVTVIDGGHREDLAVELWLLPAGAEPPEPYPHLKPEEVQIIFEKPKRRDRKNR